MIRLLATIEALDVRSFEGAGCVRAEDTVLEIFSCALAGKMLTKAKIAVSRNNDLLGKLFS